VHPSVTDCLLFIVWNSFPFHTGFWCFEIEAAATGWIW